MDSLIRADCTINIALEKDDCKNEQWIVDDIVSLEKRIQDRKTLNGYCTYTFRNWRFGETTNDGCITGVTVDLMITFNNAI